MKTIPALLTAGILLLAYDGIRAGTPDGTCGATGISPQVSAFGDPLVATDALGRELPNYAQTGGEKPNRYVGLFYWLWHGPLRNDTPDYDISKTLRKSRIARNGRTWLTIGGNPSSVITAHRTRTSCRNT